MTELKQLCSEEFAKKYVLRLFEAVRKIISVVIVVKGALTGIEQMSLNIIWDFA